MRVLVTGASGVLGRFVASALVERGHEVSAFNRRGVSLPAVVSHTGDLTTGAGLADALAGVDCVVDCATLTTMSRARSVRHFSAAGRHLSELGAAAGVGHHVVVGIVNADVVPYPYYAGKVVQERIALAGPVPATVLRATQFHEFVGQFLARLKLGRWSFVPPVRFRPIAAASVAEVLADLVDAGPGGRVPDVAGPREESLVDLARKLDRSLVRLPAVGRVGRAMAGGGLLPGPDAVLRGPTFDEWLAGRP